MACTYRTLAILSDLHIGNYNCRYELVKKSINRCKLDDIDEVWLGGDLIEYVSKYSVGKQAYSIATQKENLIHLLTPIKDKITKIILGNHEERALRVSDEDPMENIALRLGLYDKYVKSNVDMGTYYGFNYYFEHPLRGGGTTFSYLQTLAKRYVRNFPEVELFILPHFHKFDYFTLNGIGMNKKTRVKKHFVFEGGYVDYWDSFGHMTRHEVSELGSHMITFDLNDYTIEVRKL